MVMYMKTLWLVQLPTVVGYNSIYNSILLAINKTLASLCWVQLSFGPNGKLAAAYLGLFPAFFCLFESRGSEPELNGDRRKRASSLAAGWQTEAACRIGEWPSHSRTPGWPGRLEGSQLFSPSERHSCGAVIAWDWDLTWNVSVDTSSYTKGSN